MNWEVLKQNNEMFAGILDRPLCAWRPGLGDYSWEVCNNKARRGKSYCSKHKYLEE